MLQIRLIVNALKTNVVELIQDLNGNHVIQKCLNRLSNDDAKVRAAKKLNKICMCTYIY